MMQDLRKESGAEAILCGIFIMQEGGDYAGQTQRCHRRCCGEFCVEKELERHKRDHENPGHKHKLCQVAGPSLATWPPSVCCCFSVLNGTRFGKPHKDSHSLPRPGFMPLPH